MRIAETPQKLRKMIFLDFFFFVWPSWKINRRSVKMFMIFMYYLNEAEVILDMSPTVGTRLNKNKLFLKFLYFSELLVLKAVEQV